MGVYIRFIILSLTIVRSSVTTSLAVQDSIPDDLVIKLERTVCFGECPAYSVTIDAKGNVAYDGNKFVRVVDRQTDRIPLSRVTALLGDTARINGVRFAEGEVSAGAVVIASGGIGGNLDIVRRNWPANLGGPPQDILMGSHYYADGAMHEEVQRLGGNVTHIDRMWNYADAVRHPSPRRPLHGLKLIPPRSGLVLDPTGRRYGPDALIPTFDAYHALERMCEDERKYYWMICNWKIARRELDVSGSQHNPAIREKRLVRFLLSVLLGKPTLVRYFVENCPDFVTADSLEELGRRMAAVTDDGALDAEQMMSEVRSYDATIARGPSQFNDDQLRKIEQLRHWRGDRLRTCKFQAIEDPDAGPLIAIRMTVLARKSLGGIQTDLSSRVLRPDGEPIDGLYAAGEAAGFGGGGMHGRRSLEGTFLGGCVFSGRLAGQAISAAGQVPAAALAPPAAGR